MPDDGFRYELVEGELKKTVPVGSEHGYVALRFGRLLGNYVGTSGLGRVYAAETGFKLASNPDTVHAPAVASVRRERVEAAGRVEGFWPGVPDLAVEVVSPNDRASEVLDKVDDWLRAGTWIVWVVYSSPVRLFVYRADGSVQQLGPDEEVEGGDVLPGFRLPVAALFS